MQTYSLPIGPAFDRDRWNTSNPVTDEMRPLYNAIAAAMDSGIFYTRDMLKHITERFAFTGSGLDSHKNVEGGAIGMEIYYARRRIDADRNAIAQKAALERLAIGVGDKLGPLYFPSIRKGMYRNNSVIAITAQEITFEGTAGNRRFTVKASPTAVENALTRARNHRLAA